jgi:hypothetical protein
MLMDRTWNVPLPVDSDASLHTIACLTSKLHRISKGAQRASIAECNGEMWDGQRERGHKFGPAQMSEAREYFRDVDEQIAKYAARIDRQIEKLNLELASLSIVANRNGDPRGAALKLTSTDPANPLPTNCWDAETWAVV